MIKKIFKIITIILIVLFTVVLVSFILLSSRVGERFVQRFIITQLEQTTHRKVALRDLRTNIVSNIVINDFEIAARDSISPVLAVGRLGIRYNLFALLQKRISIEQLAIDSLRINLILDKAGRLDFPFLDQESAVADTTGAKAGLPLNIRIDECSLRRTYLSYNETLTPLETTVRNLNLVTSFIGGKLNEYMIESDEVRFDYRDTRLQANELHLHGLWSVDRLSVDSLSTMVEGLAIDGQAMLTNREGGPVIDARLGLDGAIDGFFARLGSLLDPGLTPVGGMVKTEIAVAGNVSNPRIDVHLKGKELAIAKVPLKHVDMKAQYFEQQVKLGSLLVEAFGGEMMAGGEISLDSLLTHHIDLRVSEFDLASIRNLFLEQNPVFAGKMNGMLRSKGRLADLNLLDLYSQIVISDMDFGYPDTRLRSQMVNRIRIKQGELHQKLNYNSSFLETTIKLDGKRLKGQFTGDLIDLDMLTELLNIQNAGGRVRAQGALYGSIDHPIVTGEIRGDSLKYNNVPLDSLYAQFVYQDREIVLNTVEFLGTMQWSDSTNSPFYLPATKGAFEYKGLLRGPVSDLTGEFTMSLRDVLYENYRIDNGEITAEYKDQTFELSSAEVSKDSLTIHLTATYLPDDMQGEMNVTLYAMDPPLQLPEDRTNSYAKQSATKYPRREAGKLRVRFDYSVPQILSFTSVGDSIDIQSVLKLSVDQDRYGGLLNYRSNGVLSYREPDIELDFSVINPFFESVRFDSIHGEVRVDAREARLIDLSGFVDNNINSIQARLGLRRDEEGLVRIGEVNPFSGKMNGKNFDLRLLDSFMPESMSAEGRASFNVAWNGTVAEPHINGDMSLLQGAFTIEQKKRLLHNLNLVTSVYDSVLVIESITGYYNSMSFTGSGALNASRMRRYSGNFEIVLPDHGKMHVDGSISSDSLSIAAVVNELDLKLFQPLIPAVDKFSGRCDLQLDVGGTTKDPVVMGSMEIDHLTATYSQWNMEFSEGYARLNFERDVIRIDSLYTRLNSGTIVSEGRLYLDDNTINALDVHVRADSIDVKVKDEFEVSLKRADIRYETQKDVHVLQGEAVFGESKILYNFSPTSILPFARRVEKPARALPDLLNKTRMNVKIREGDHLWVDNNLARIRLYPELTVYGYLSGINLRGRVTAIEGYVLYLDRKFNMKTGTVDFVDPNRINPNIDIEAVAALKSYQTFDDKDYTITLSISGLLDQAEVKLTSDPELGKSDILALLTLGFTRDQLSGNHMGNGQETKVSDLIKARLEMYSSQRISYFASQKVGNLFGLESMSIEGNLFDFGSSWGPQLVASKKITNRIQLTYDTSVGELNQQGIRLDYRIKNNLYIQGQTDQSGRSAIDLKFGIKFK